MYITAIIFYVLSLIFTGAGFDKLNVYINSTHDESKNAYVGGDAYNYIINANYASAYFILSVGLALIATIFLCSKLVLKHQEKQTKYQKYFFEADKYQNSEKKDY